jgi:CHAD domain-containing protein
MTADPGKDFLAALDAQWDAYRAQFKAGRRGITEETIHDLRVAARRFLALLDIITGLTPRPRVKELRRFLKKQLDELDELRDAQVMLAEAGRRLRAIPQLDAFQAYLEKRAMSLTRSARKKLRDSRPSDLGKLVKRMRTVAEQHTADVRFFERLLQSVDDAYSGVVRAVGKLDAADPATVHRVRIAFKRFRYTIETLQPLLPDYPKPYVARMHAYQDAMGRVRDTTVFLDALQKFEGRPSMPAPAGQPALDPEPIERFYQKRLSKLMRAYFEGTDEFQQYWRTAPDQRFPWEQSHDPLYSAPRHRRGTGQQQQRGAGQPASSDGRGRQEDAPDRPGAEEDGGADRSDPDQPVSSGG